MRLVDFLPTILAFVFVSGCSQTTPRSPDPDADLDPVQRIGKAAFFDTALSEPPGTSCASCHDPARAFSGNHGSTTGVPLGSDGTTLGLRNTPSAMYAMFSPPFAIVDSDDGPTPTGGQFLDGRVDTLEEQARLPLLSASEMANPSEAHLAAKVMNAAYAGDMLAQFGPEVFATPQKAIDALTAAIGAFERSARFAPFSSKYDRYVQGRETLTAQESRGLALFMDAQKGNCAACHAADPNSKVPRDSLFTDFTYDNLGVPRNRAIPANADPSFFDLGLCGPKRAPVADTGACGAFKVPTLRNATRKAAFMHNGYFTRLRDVVAFYVTRDTSPERWYAGGVKFDDLPEGYRANVNVSEVPYDRKPGEAPRLTEAEIDDLVAFLGTLEDAQP